jgi:hypothetical protein
MSMSNGIITKPKLKIIDDLKSENKEVVTYSPYNSTITIFQSFIDLTRKFGKDSTNARAHVLCHELAHVFLRHGYANVIGTGFASKEMNREYKKTKESLEDKLGEMEADQWAFFYAYIAGFKTNQIVPQLLDSIYKYYKLNDNILSTYPKLIERKKYANFASVKMASMCESFDFANMALLHKDFKISIGIYENIINEGFKSREIYSNLGTATLLYALSLKSNPQFDLILPLQIDMDTRLNQNLERGLSDDPDVNELIKNSLLFFKEAIRIDSEYGIAYLNLAIANWLAGEIDEMEFYITKAKKTITRDYQNRIETFIAITKIKSEDEKKVMEGILDLNRLATEGYNLAQINIDILNKQDNNSNKIQPKLDINLDIDNLPENFNEAKNILDSTFRQDRYPYPRITCKEKNEKITYRRWKFENDDESSIVLQYIISPIKKGPISNEKKNNLIKSATSIFETGQNTYLCYNNDVIIIIDQNNNLQYQIIKS